MWKGVCAVLLVLKTQKLNRRVAEEAGIAMTPFVLLHEQPRRWELSWQYKEPRMCSSAPGDDQCTHAVVRSFQHKHPRPLMCRRRTARSAHLLLSHCHLWSMSARWASWCMGCCVYRSHRRGPTASMHGPRHRTWQAGCLQRREKQEMKRMSDSLTHEPNIFRPLPATVERTAVDSSRSLLQG